MIYNRCIETLLYFKFNIFIKKVGYIDVPY